MLGFQVFFRNFVTNMRHFFTFILLFYTALIASAKNDFTDAEQQQISLETPGLFAKSASFQVDFSILKQSEYSFPLPVGKVINETNSILEIETAKGDAVKAMFDGTVRLSRAVGLWGNVVVVRHNNGLETVYSGNAQNLVKVGDKVKAGQTIAIVGNGINVNPLKQTPNTLAFFIQVNGRRINPSTLLDPKNHKLFRQVVTFKKKPNGIDITTSRKEKANTEPEGMSMDTNNPFGSNSTYRLDLRQIKSWHYPLNGSHLISDYGGRRNHAGIDIKNGAGKEVYALFDGLVVQSGVFSGYGKCVTLRHANGLETRYAHNSKNYVKVGDKVKAGDVLGLTGRTGRATTEHVHFETRINGRAFNPNYVLDVKNQCLQNCVLQFKKGGGVVKLKD